MITEKIKKEISFLFKDQFQAELSGKQLQLQDTRPEFEGDITLVVFPLASIARQKPEETASMVGEYLKQHIEEIESYNVVKGFLNIVYKPTYWIKFLQDTYKEESYGTALVPSNKMYVVEYSSPNTNKPLHLGHLRNNFIGYSVAEILKANGHEVKKVQIINDRGIHICKSMLAWQKSGLNETPESTGLKGDKLVGKYYVEFDKAYKKEIEALTAGGHTLEDAEKNAPIMVEAQEMLRKWEAGDPDTIDLWKKMNGWVYDGFNQTYKTLKVDFDKLYYESDTYILGKDLVENGLSKGVFKKKEDGSVWVDNSDEGLDEKILLRKDGTSVYMTQDLGTAVLRYKDFPNVSGMIYTVGNEQDHHFKVLFATLKKLGYEWAKECYHLSYGMVDLPSGKMKSREGTVVDADDLVEEIREEAAKKTAEQGKVESFTDAEKEKLYEVLALGALKYYILKVDPKKRMLYNPSESVDLTGNTGVFIQYTYARTNSVLNKVEHKIGPIGDNTPLNKIETGILKWINKFPEIIKEAGDKHSPAEIANYIYELVKQYNYFYHECPILKEENADIKNMRLALTQMTGNTIKTALRLLGVEVPERM